MSKVYVQHHRNSLKRYRELTDPGTQLVDFAIRFRIVDGVNKGKITRGFGGVWNKVANRGTGQFEGVYDANGQWRGTADEPGPGRVRIVDVAQQQWPYIEDFRSRMILAEGARRSGKSFALAPKVVLSAMHHPGAKGVLLGPTYRQINNVWGHIRRITPRHWLMPGTLGINQTKKTLRFINGSTVVLLHAYKDDASRSEGCAWGGYDERQDISDNAAANALLSTSEGGKHFHIFETATIKAELRDHHDALMEAKDCEVYRMTGPDNPFVNPALFEFAERMLDRAAVEREIYARWPELVGRCYYPFIWEEGGHIREAPLRDGDGNLLEDITVNYCAAKFGTPSFGDKAARVIIGVDPPHHAAIYKVHKGDILHQIDEVIVGMDDLRGDVRALAHQCGQLYPGGVVIRDPHDTRSGGQQGGRRGSHDADKYFRMQGYRIVHCPYVGVEYQLTAVRARMEQEKLFVAPRCRHTIECYTYQTYKGARPDKQIRSKISQHMTVDHAGDATRYPVYKLFPARVDYAKREKSTA